jgi:hypothetical protein
MGEIYPLGGAGDRLGLVDERSGECLPVAMLPYCGRTLLEGLIRDLQASHMPALHKLKHNTIAGSLSVPCKRLKQRCV